MNCGRVGEVVLHVGGNAVASEGVLRHVHPLGDSLRRCPSPARSSKGRMAQEAWHPADMFFCPISMQIMTDPVSTVDGFTVRDAAGRRRGGARG